jgi:16S rRNA A1518/A1519 N6-dimethyltransferase RsmA/KsgA/DIM1 with predicted DNA glycosylase/AP lyase activity
VAVSRPARGAPGRHFLRSKRLAAELVAEAEIARGDLVLEIGGGTGMLTKAIARTGAGLVVIERDRALAAQLRNRFAHLAAVEILEEDATEHDGPGQPFTVVANLTFAGSGE